MWGSPGIGLAVAGRASFFLFVRDMKKTGRGNAGFFGDKGWHGGIMAGFRGGRGFFLRFVTDDAFGMFSCGSF